MSRPGDSQAQPENPIGLQAPNDRLGRALRDIAVAVGLAYLATFLVVAVRRMGYPFELEWMEGGMVDHVLRLLAGQKLYVAPSLDFVPYTYTPLYFYVSAAASRLMGAGFLPLRLVSLVAALGCMALIAGIVRRCTHRWTPALLAATLFAASFRASGAWFDIARVDSLFLLFVLGAITVLHLRSSVTAGVVAGILIACSFYTKQAGLLMGIPIAAGAIVLDRRMGIACAATAALLIGGGVLLFDRATGGWFTFYVFEMPRMHGVVRRMLLDFWVLDLGRKMLIACILTAPLFTARWLPRSARIFYALLVIALIGGTYAIRVREGSYDNILMPAYAMLAILAGIATPIAASRPGRAAIIHAAWIAQFALLFYNPTAQIPTAADERAGRALIEGIRRIDGPVFIPCHGYLAAMAGKPSHAQMMALGDVLRSPRADVRDRLNAEVSTAVREHRFAAIFQDGEWLAELERAYQPAGPVFQSPTVFWTRTGLRTRPQLIYVAR
jgi:hypothetical protein